MAQVTATVDFPAPPDEVWPLMADPRRYEDWLTIHQGWRGELPEELSVGAKLTEIVTVLGMANKIEWTVEEYRVPTAVRICGTGMAGAQVSFTLSVEPSGAGSRAAIDAEFTGQLVVGAIGAAVAKQSKKELDASLAKLADLVG
ncbi:MAG: SRPBCC family protein [Actinophytocola sp.]|uniref:type II toxin-antitoxin system Rv0910 family toxin n=1 Tax=Actinophytocola sp. TaxID=1872138 RepID=UPI0013206FF1|nr:SRPBCC family protein [Actinophytocola sp.]MPZ82426.1 SRPBCC family protein [Actinophytocola sp.]